MKKLLCMVTVLASLLMLSANFATAAEKKQSFRTTKPVLTDIHSETESLIEFKFTALLDDLGIMVKVTPYRISTTEKDGETVEVLTEIKGTQVKRQITNEEMEALILQVKPITPPNDNPKIYFTDLVANGIKLIIISEGLWQNKLSINDFE